MALAGIYFVYSATVEERYLTEQFPDTYPMYKRSTKMLVPFIFYWIRRRSPDPEVHAPNNPIRYLQSRGRNRHAHGSSAPNAHRLRLIRTMSVREVVRTDMRSARRLLAVWPDPPARWHAAEFAVGQAGLRREPAVAAADDDRIGVAIDERRVEPPRSHHGAP